jgi:hypothetical protein
MDLFFGHETFKNELNKPFVVFVGQSRDSQKTKKKKSVDKNSWEIVNWVKMPPHNLSPHLK